MATTKVNKCYPHSKKGHLAYFVKNEIIIPAESIFIVEYNGIF